MPMIESSAASSWLETVMWKQCSQRSLHSKTISVWYSNHHKGHSIWSAILSNSASFCIWLWIIFDIPLTLPQRRENSGCTSPNNWTVTTQTSIHSNRLYLTLIIFTYNIHTSACNSFWGTLPRGSLGSCADNWLLIVTPSQLSAFI